MYSQEHCVYKAADLGEADIAANWLSEQGIETYVKDGYSACVMQVPGIVAPAGIEVCVVDPGEVERARQLLADHMGEIVRGGEEAVSAGAVEAVCAECGKVGEFEGAQRGRVEECPHCGAYVDVPE